MPNGYDHPHLHIRFKGKREAYKSRLRVIPPEPPGRDRSKHGALLQDQYSRAIESLRHQNPDAEGFYLKFTVPAEHEHIVESLESQKKQIEVVATKPLEDGATVAVVFIPETQQNFFPVKLDAYQTKNTKSGRPKNNDLIARIEEINPAQFEDLFVGEALPALNEIAHWELWIRKNRFSHFRSIGIIDADEGVLNFPERVVVPFTGTRAQVQEIVSYTDAIAEVRVNSTPAPFIIDVPNDIQGVIAANLVSRTTFSADNGPIVCLLDTGVNRGHPLLENAIAAQQVEAFNPAWGGNDIHGHGTGMAGLCLFGDIGDLLTADDQVAIRHKLQSIKILGPVPNDARLYGSIMTDSVNKSDITAPQPNKVICMAVTSTERLEGKPSSWSAAIDQLCFADNDDRKRLFIVSAGNFRDTLDPANYPAENDMAAVENPAQAWNALVAGACTQKSAVRPENAAFSLFAPSGGLSPRSRTSVSWSRQWPIRPDVVLEGGNFVHDGNVELEAPELKVVTTNHEIATSHFRTFGDTSAASALAAKLAAMLMERYPDYWPETIRALIVHSAAWTDAMRTQAGGAQTKQSRNLLLRRFGFGLPDLSRAIASADSDVSLVMEDTLQPFRQDAGTGKSNEMVLHTLPWPRAQLQEAGASLVRIKITLSYFIEPNPGKSWSRKHTYQSHALRFALKRSTETLEAFRARVNAAIEAEESGGSGGGDSWFLGALRNGGSIHSDTWETTAAEMADMDAFGIYPIGGWWKNNPKLGKVNSKTRYAVIVSLAAPAQLQIYAPIETLVKQVIQVES